MSTGTTSGFETFPLGTLTSANVSTAEEVVGQNLTFQVVITNISGSVVLRFEGSLDGTSYGNLNGSTDTTITANGTYLYGLAEFPVRFVRYRYVSGTGTAVVTLGSA